MAGLLTGYQSTVLSLKPTFKPFWFYKYNSKPENVLRALVSQQISNELQGYTVTGSGKKEGKGDY